MKKTAIIILAAIAMVFATCKKHPEVNVQRLVLSDEIVDVTGSHAILTATYSYPSELQSIKMLVSEGSDMADATETNATIEGANLHVVVNNLWANTTYYYCLRYANKISSADTEVKSFTTTDATLPAVETESVSEITMTSAKVGGNVTDTGGAPITERGICYGTNHNPDLNGSHLADAGGATNVFTVSITGLTANTAYYARAYATNKVGTVYGEETAFVTVEGGGLPTVITNQVANITETTATTGGIVSADGGSPVIVRGVCWSTDHNPTVADAHTTDGSGIGAFTSEIIGLTANTTYYVRAYAISSNGTAYGDEEDFVTTDGNGLPVVVTLDVINITQTTAVSGGDVTSDGGAPVTSKGVCWGTSTSPTLNGSHTVDGSGLGSYTSRITGLSSSTVYYVRAYATNENGTSYGSVLSFTTPQLEAPEGAIAGLFSVSEGRQVWFSQGNLQYQASTNTWRFADNQYDYIGEDNTNISWIYNGWIDLFGWGTSGYNHGAVAYQPWSTTGDNTAYYAYGDINYNLNDQTGQADWGYNPIINGGNTEHIWRTLTSEEWNYLLYIRGTYTGARFALGIVNDINGIILLPDYWDNAYTLNNLNPEQGGYGLTFENNIISLSDWLNILEANGAIFLPAGGRRTQNNQNQNYGTACYYWTATIGDNGYVCMLQFEQPYWVFYGAHASRFDGNSVRLVQDALH